MRLAFMGTPVFAVPTLKALYAAGHDIAAVYTQAPKRAGRGQHEMRSPVHRAAENLGLPVRTPAKLRGNDDEEAFLSALDLDAVIVTAYGLMLPEKILNLPKHGCINVHASLLPRWRGAAPIQAAILAGDVKTGVTIMQMDPDLDRGPILLAESVPLSANATAASVHDTLAALGAELLLRVLVQFPKPTPQRDEEATYAPKLSRADAVIDWTASAEVIERRIRAFTPWPGTLARLEGEPIKILEGTVIDMIGEPGVAIDDHLTIACGSRSLRVTKLQRAGRAALESDDFLRGHPVPSGTRLN